MASKANAYDVTLHEAYRDGTTDRNRNERWIVQWQDADGEIRQARTQGYMTPVMMGLRIGQCVDVIRNGRGSVIAIFESGPES